MQTFKTLTARAVSIPEDDVDTDIIFPARFLLITDKAGLGRYAFHDRPYGTDGDLGAGFLVDKNAGILIAGANFGCGSSREQAVWALASIGIRCIIAPSFGEIFQGNCVQNGILPIALDEVSISHLRIAADAAANLTVDLVAKTILAQNGRTISFAIDDWRRAALLNGWDEIDTILRFRSPDIAQFEERQKAIQPWLWKLSN